MIPFKPLFDQEFCWYSYLFSEIECKETVLVYTSTNCTRYTVHCNLESPCTQSSALQIRVSTSSYSWQRFKGYCFESDMSISKWKATSIYAYSPFTLVYPFLAQQLCTLHSSLFPTSDWTYMRLSLLLELLKEIIFKNSYS